VKNDNKVTVTITVLTKIVHKKNNRGRECQAITDVYLILLSLRQKNFLKQLFVGDDKKIRFLE